MIYKGNLLIYHFLDSPHILVFTKEVVKDKEKYELQIYDG
jgi:hypothetical protein